MAPTVRGEAVGLSAKQRATLRALMHPMLGVPADPLRVQTAVDRLDDYLRTIPEVEAVRELRMMILLVRMKSYLEHRRAPEDLSDRQMEAFLHTLVEGEGTFFDWLVDRITDFAPGRNPSVRDLARSLREMLSLAYWTNPETDRLSGYTPVWKRSDIWTRSDVDPAARPRPRGPYIDVAAVRGRHRIGHPYDAQRLFANDRPGRRVAVIGSGAGGAVVAARLARADWDVAVFDSGPRMRPAQYPLDALEGMSLLFENGLLTTSRNVDMHLLRARVVGGGTVLTSGMSLQMWPDKLAAWNERGMGLDPEAMWKAFGSVEKRIALAELDPEITQDAGKKWQQGAALAAKLHGELIYQIGLSSPPINVMARPGQHPDRARIPDLVGTHCLRCGLCNYGCHFGHKLSMDLTYLLDAEDAGARIHQNLPVERLIGEWDAGRGRMRVTGLVFGRDTPGIAEVDHVVLAAGAVGSPALMLRTCDAQRAWRHLRPFHGPEDERPVGNRLGFNYGTTVVARFPDGYLDDSADEGIQINFVGEHTAGQREKLRTRNRLLDFVLENAFIPPGLLANVVPGIGEEHYRWMRSYERLGMAVNTIGSPMNGRVAADRDVAYAIETQGELDTIHESIALIVKQYLYGGAETVGLAGVRSFSDAKNWFTAEDRERTHADIVRRVREMAPRPDRLMVSSAHPQGGLGMSRDPALGAVAPDFRFHDTDNLYVSDASLFPESIVVNPQWTVMALATVAAEAIERSLSDKRYTA